MELHDRVKRLSEMAEARSSSQLHETAAHSLASIRQVSTENALTKLNNEFEHTCVFRYPDTNFYQRVVCAVEFVEENMQKYMVLMNMAPDGMLKARIARTLIKNTKDTCDKSDDELNQLIDVLIKATKRAYRINGGGIVPAQPKPEPSKRNQGTIKALKRYLANTDGN